MRKIGNIITDSKFEDNGLFNVVRTIDNALPGIPTLIVGWQKAKSIYPKLDILDWHIKDDVYWTFGKRERNWYYEDNIRRFKENCLDFMGGEIKYAFFNILTEPKESKYIFVAWIMEPRNKKYVFLKNGMAYLYIEGRKTIYGISLRDIDYASGSHKKFMVMMSSSNSVTMVKPDMDLYDIRALAQSTPYIIPYLYSVD